MSERRKNIRLNQWNYSSSASYHVTFCTKDKAKTLGSISLSETDEATLVPTPFGTSCEDAIRMAVEHFGGFDVVKSVVMPNHVHMLVMIDGSLSQATLGRFVGYVKSAATRLAKNQGFSHAQWQRGYYDHIIRGEADFTATWDYIDTNPARWADDEYYL